MSVAYRGWEFITKVDKNSQNITMVIHEFSLSKNWKIVNNIQVSSFPNSVRNTKKNIF